MVKIAARALGNLHCEATHEPSGTIMQTDAPTDVGGEASSFSPTDLLATGLLTCILTTMGLVAQRLNLDISGATGTVEKIMRDTPPRRIERLNVQIQIPLNPDDEAKRKLESAAQHCPVHLSLHPDTIQDIVINWE